MAILGIGTDIVDVARIEKLLRDKRDEFLARVFTPEEAAYCDEKARPAIHYAARFAAKEALMKAIGTGWAKGVGFGDIRVVNDPDGKPGLQTQGETKRILDGFGPSFLWLSMSHTREYATATVIIEAQTEQRFHAPQAPHRI
ncbi:MAG: holo-ACP synthase [Planctomycetes bacterium]|nr:holo-ACP synthase [Planctomycetota bacterium]